MKVKFTIGGDDYASYHILKVDGDTAHHIHDLSECPEDAIIGRDLIDGYDLLHVLKLGYEAGKRGESLEIEQVDGEEE